MDYIDKLFGQHPFIYYINGKYYAFGFGVCVECDGNSALLERRYKDFEDSLDMKLDDKEAWEIFHKLSAEASFAGKKSEECIRTKEEFGKMDFSEEDKTNLKKQINRYRKYWEERHLSQFFN